MKCGQLVKDNGGNIFLQKSCRKRGRETSSRRLWFFRKFYIRSTQVVSTFVLIHFGRLPLGHTIKTNLMFLIVDPEMWLFLIFD